MEVAMSSTREAEDIRALDDAELDAVTGGMLQPLIMYDAGGTPVARYHLEHAWPS
jgi:hypothetical protein